MNASDKRYTDSWARFLGWNLGRALLRCAAGGSGMCGSVIPVCTAINAVDEGFPPLIWWRTGVRDGIAAAEAFANNSAPAPGNPSPARTRERPSDDGVG